MNSLQQYEQASVYLCVAGLAAAWLASCIKLHWRLILLGLLAVVITSASAIALRWIAAEQGPFLTLYEVILSNLFSVSGLYAIAYRYSVSVRVSATAVLSMLLLMGVWLLMLPAKVVPLPATFDNYWLWIHVAAGKLFLAACFVGAGSAAVLLCRHFAGALTAEVTEELDAVVWRFMSTAFVAHSSMLVAGAVWAYDAWGRYWAWDPLETWVFITWLVQGLTLHCRVSLRLPYWLLWLLVELIFVLAFMTFFGVPFLSDIPHAGVM